MSDMPVNEALITAMQDLHLQDTPAHWELFFEELSKSTLLLPAEEESESEGETESEEGEEQNHRYYMTDLDEDKRGLVVFTDEKKLRNWKPDADFFYMVQWADLASLFEREDLPFNAVVINFGWEHGMVMPKDDILKMPKAPVMEEETQSEEPSGGEWRILPMDPSPPPQVISRLKEYMSENADVKDCYLYKNEFEPSPPRPMIGLTLFGSATAQQREDFFQVLRQDLSEEIRKMGGDVDIGEILPDSMKSIRQCGTLIVTKKKVLTPTGKIFLFMLPVLFAGLIYFLFLRR